MKRANLNYFLKRYIFIHIRTINFVTKKYTKKHSSRSSCTCRVFKCKSRLVAETRPYRRAAHCRALPVLPVTSASHPPCRHEARWKPKKIQQERPDTAVHRTKKATNAVDLSFWKGGFSNQPIWKIWSKWKSSSWGVKIKNSWKPPPSCFSWWFLAGVCWVRSVWCLDVAWYLRQFGVNGAGQGSRPFEGDFPSILWRRQMHSHNSIVEFQHKKREN